MKSSSLLRAFKLFVLFGIPLLGILYAYQFTDQQREVIVPFKPFKAPAILVHKGGDAKASFDFPLKAKVTALNYWATWCPPCVEEFPAMIELQRQLKGSGVEIVFVSVDEKWENVEKFLKTNQVPFDPEHMFWDPQKSTAKMWGSVKFPETYVVRKDSWVVEKIIGAQQWTRPVVIRYFTDLARKFQDVAETKRGLMNFVVSSAFAASSNQPEALINDEDKKTLERMRANIETATQNLQRAEAAQKEEDRNLREQKIVLERRQRDLSESESDLAKIQSKLQEVKTTLERTDDSLKSEDREKSRVERQIKDIQTRISALQKQLESAKDELTQANKSLNTRLQTLDTLAKSKDSTEEESKVLEGKVGKARSLVDERKKTAHDISSDVALRERKLRDIQSQITSAQETLKQQKDKLSEFEKLLKR